MTNQTDRDDSPFSDNDSSVEAIVDALRTLANFSTNVSRSRTLLDTFAIPMVFLAFVALSGGLYLLYSLSLNARFLAVSMDSNERVIASNIESLSDNLGKITSNSRTIAIAADAVLSDTAVLEPMRQTLKSINYNLSMLSWLEMYQVLEVSEAGMRENLLDALDSADSSDSDIAATVQRILTATRARFGEMGAVVAADAAFYKRLLEIHDRSPQPVWDAIGDSVGRLLKAADQRLAYLQQSDESSESFAILTRLLAAHECLDWVEGGIPEPQGERERMRFRRFFEDVKKHSTPESDLAHASQDILNELDSRKASRGKARISTAGERDAGTDTDDGEPSGADFRQSAFEQTTCGI